MDAEAGLQAQSENYLRAAQIEGEARAILEATGSMPRGIYNYILSGLGEYLHLAGRGTEALGVFRLVVANDIRNGRGGTRAQLIDETNVASALYGLGEIREAYEIQNRIEEELAPLEKAESVHALATINTVDSATRLMLSRSEQPLTSAIEQCRRARDWASFKLGNVVLARARLLSRSSRRLVQDALDNLETASNEGQSPITLSTRIQVEIVRSELDLRDGNPQVAHERAQRLLQMVDKQNSASTARSKFLVLLLAAKTSLAIGDVVQAQHFADSSLKIAEPIARGPDTSADVGEALLIMARALLAQGKAGDSRPMLERASRCLTNGYGVKHPRTLEAQNLLLELK